MGHRRLKKKTILKVSNLADKMLKKNKNKLIPIGAGLGVFAVLGGIMALRKLKSPIFGVTWKSKENGKLDIAWYDDEPGNVYSIFWSNRRGVNVKDRSTYLKVAQVITVAQFGTTAHHLATLEVHEEWVYFVISKGGYFTKEFEAKVEQDDTFDVKKLNLQVLRKPSPTNDIVISLRVFKNVEIYRISKYNSEGSCESYDFWVSGVKSVDLRFPLGCDEMVFISSKVGEKWSPREFLFYLENFSSGLIKWEKETRL